MPGGYNSSATNVSVGGTAVQLILARTTRQRLLVRNNHATQILYLGTDSGVTTSTGFPVAAATTLAIENHVGPLWAIASGAATDVRLFDVY